MFRAINLKEENNFKAVLMKNRREELIEIPNEYITEVLYKLNDMNEMTIEVPSVLQRGHEKFDNPLYGMLKGKRHIVVDFNGEKERYVIDDDLSVLETKNKKVKTAKAYSFEKTLVSKSFLIGEGATRQLYRPSDDNVDISDGVLNWLEQQTSWKVNYVDFEARKELGMYTENFDGDLFLHFQNELVEVDKVLWEQEISVDIGDKPLNMSVIYNGLETYDGDLLLKRENITHNFTNLPYAVQHIKATYTSDSNYRFGMTYEITFANGAKHTQKFGFANAKNLKVKCDRVTVNYETGNRLEKYMTKYRFFEHASTTWYAFLKNEVEEAFNVVIKFNTFDQTINVYSKDTLGEARGLYLSYDNFIKEINKTEKVGEIVTRLWVESPNVDIIGENPLGTQYLEDFTYFIDSGTMSPELQSALKRYYAHIDVKQHEWEVVKDLKLEVDQLKIKRDSELTSLNERLKVANSLLTAYIKAEDVVNQEATSQEIAQLEQEIADLLLVIQELKEQSDEYGDQMASIGHQIARENAMDSNGKIFDEIDLEELSDMTVEETLSNDYYTVAYSLYKHAQESIRDKNKLRIEFNINLNDFLTQLRHPKGWSFYVRLGDKIEVDDRDISDKDGYIRITSFSFSPKTNKLSNLDFSNDTVVVETIKTISDIGRKVQQTASMTDFWKSTWNDSKNANVLVSDLRKNGLDLASSIVSGRNTVNQIDISEAGIFVIDNDNKNNQIYVGSSMIAITDTRWRTAKTAIDSNGVIADTVIGRLLMGEQLFISNKDGSFTIEGHGLTLRDELQRERIFLGIEQVGNQKKARLRMTSANDSSKLVLSEEGMYQVLPINTRDNFDKDHPFYCDFYLGNNVQRIDKATLRLRLQKFRAYTRGGASKEGSSSAVTSTSGGYSSKTVSSTNGGGYSDAFTSNSGGNWSSTKTSTNGGSHTSTKSSASGGASTITSGIASAGSASIKTSTGTTAGYGVASLNTTNAQSISGTYHQHAITTASLNNHTHSFSASIGSHSHAINASIGSHSHNVGIEIPSHSHNVTIDSPAHSHYVNIAIPNHNHTTTIEIPNHTHNTTVTIPSHNHPEQYGIYEFSQSPTVDVYLDNVLIASGVNADREIDITSKITSITGWHTIKVVGKTSGSNSLGLGRIELDASISCFVSY